MANRYEQFLQVPAPSKGNRYDQFVAPPPPPPEPEDIEPWWVRAGQSLNNANRSMADTMTFGLFDKAMEYTGIEPGAIEKTAQARKDSPVASVVGDIAGGAAASGVFSAGAGLIPGLAKNTIPRIMAREGLAGTAFAATDDLAREGELNPLGELATGVTSAGLSGILAAGSRLFPMGRIRAAGRDFTPDDKKSIQELMEYAKSRGIDLNIPEAAAARAPARAGEMDNLYARTTGVEPGIAALRNKDGARQAGILAAGKQIVDDIGPGVRGDEVQKAAKDTIKKVVDQGMDAAQPFYDASANTKVKMPRTKPAAFKEGMSSLASDKVTSEALAVKQGRGIGKKPVKTDITYWDGVKKEIDHLINTSEALGKNSLRTASLKEAKKALTNILDAANPDYAKARQIAEGVLARKDALEAGPLGAMMRTDSGRAQGTALFGATNSVEKAAAEEAIDLLPQGIPRGILSNTIETGVSKKEIDFARSLLQTPQSKELAQKVLGSDYGRIGPTLESAAAVKKAPNAMNANNQDHLFESVFRHLRNLGAGRAVDKMYDPKTVKQLGELGPLLELLLRTGTGTVTQSDPIRLKENRK